MSRGQFSRSDMTTSAWLFKLTSMLYWICRLWQGKIQSISEESLTGFRNICTPFRHWSVLWCTGILVPILTSKLDSLTLREWGTSLMDHEPPPLKQLLDFIAHRCEVLETTTRASTTSAKKVEAKSQPNVKRSSSCAATVKPKCNFCQEEFIYYCKNFMALPISQRFAEIRSRKLCVNLLALFFSCVK